MPIRIIIQKDILAGLAKIHLKSINLNKAISEEQKQFFYFF